MADIRIIRPQAGQRVTLEQVENARLVLAFPPVDATLERVGDNLVFKFEDGGQVELPGFYTAYTSENLPTFEVEGAEISGKDFFAALGADLMPAAGPAAPAAALSGGRYNELGTDSLMGGVDRLDGLDMGFNTAATAADNTLNALGAQGGTDVAAAAGLTGTPATPSVPGESDRPTQPDNPSNPDTPDEPGNPDKPVDPDTPVEPGNPDTPAEPDFSGLNFGTVYEGALQSGTGKHPSGQGNLSSGDLSTPLSGLPAGWEVVGGGNAHGTLVQDPATGHWSYVLGSASQEHSADSAYDSATGKVDVILRGPDGNTVTVQVDVDVVDDAPIASADAKDVAEGNTVTGSVLDNDQSGADKWPTDSEGNITAVKGVTAPEGWTALDSTDGSFVFSSAAGMITIRPDGSYEFMSSGNSTAGNTSFDFTYTAQDKDGDTAEGNLTIHVKDVDLDQVVGGGAADRVVVDENDLSTGPGAVSEPKDFTLPEGATFDPDQVTFNDKGVATVTTPNGVFTITDLGNGQYQYVYELGKAVDHDALGGSGDTLKSGADSITLPVIDGKGNTGDVTLTVDVKDDAPEGGNGTFFAKHQEDGSYKAEGSLHLDFGADGLADGGAALGLNGDWILQSTDGSTWVYTYTSPFTGFETVLTLSKPESGNDWNVSITAPDEKSMVDAFRDPATGTVQDGDGDNGGFSIGVTVDKNVTLSQDSDLTLESSDANVGKGEAAVDKGSLSLNAPDGFAGVSIGGVTLAWNGTGWVDEAGNAVTQIEGGSGFLTLGGLSGSAEDGYTVDYTYTQDKGFTQHTKPGAGEVQEKADSFDVVITDKDGSKAEAEITVDITDDAPTLSVTVGQSTTGSGNNLKPFDDLNFHDYANGDLKGYDGSKSTLSFGDVTVSAGFVNYNDKGEVGDITFGNKVLGKVYAGSGDGMHGLTVSGGGHAEINTSGDKGAEAVVFDLGGKLAYGLDLTLGCFFSGGSSSDDVSEIARLSFYRGGELIYTVDITSDRTTGIYDTNGAFKEYINGGFDRVVVSPVKNAGVSDNSDFVIREVGFETMPNADPLTITNGTVKGDSGGDGYFTGDKTDGTDYTNATFNYTDGEIRTLVDEFGKEFVVTLDVVKGTSGGDGMVTAYDAQGNPIFSALMDKDGNWTFNQYKIFSSVDGGADGDKDTFDLSFITKDKDGDIAYGSAPIDTAGDDAPPAVGDDDSFQVVYGKDHINQVRGSDGAHDNPGGNSHIKDSYDAGDGHDTLTIQGGKGNSITVDSDGNILLPGAPNDSGAGSVAFKNFEEVAGKSPNDKYELHLDGDQQYSIDDKGNVTLHFDDGKTMVFSGVEKNGITGGDNITHRPGTDAFSVQSDEGDALIFGNLGSYDQGDAEAPNVSLTGLDDGAETVDTLLGDVLTFDHAAAPLDVTDPLAGLTHMDELCDKLGIAQNNDGTPDLDAGWEVAAAANAAAAPILETVVETPPHDDISVMVQENILKADSGSA